MSRDETPVSNVFPEAPHDRIIEPVRSRMPTAAGATSTLVMLSQSLLNRPRPFVRSHL